MSRRGRRLRFRYRPSKLGRLAAYTVVLVGFVAWMVTGGWQNPAIGNANAIPVWTLLAATGAYALGAFAEKFTFEDDTPNGD